MRAKTIIIILAICATCAGPTFAGLTRHDVLVIANSNSATSRAVADYYRLMRNIPASHVKLISCTTSETVTPSEFVSIRSQIQAHLLSLGTIAGDPANDPIKAIVLATRVPHKVSDGGEAYASVDSALAALFSESSWGKEPFGVYGLFFPEPASPNAFYGDYSGPVPFSAFRANTGASSMLEAFPSPGFTLVRMLDANTALAAGGEGLLFRGVKSGDTWSWSPVNAIDKGAIGWRVSWISALDAAHAYACTGNRTKPHGGGTIIATSNGGQTWTTIRRSTRVSLFKLNNSFLGVDFADISNGFAVGSLQTAPNARSPLMIKTVNGGSSWADVSGNLPASFYPESVSAADASNVWICGNGGKIYRSTDGGLNWALANSGAPAIDYNAIWIKSSGGSSAGWAVGDSGTVIRTENGGASWTVEASGLTTRDITDLAVYDQDHACAAYGQNSFLVFVRGTGWGVESGLPASVVSAAAASGGFGLAVGGIRYIFTDSAGGWVEAYRGIDNTWRPRYLVTRLDGFPEDIAPADGIPDDIKAMIDRAYGAASRGRWIMDEAIHYNGQTITADLFQDAYNALVSVVPSTEVTWEKTATYLTGQNNVIGWSSRGMGDQDADNYTVWGRPLHQWANGGVGTVYESTDGRTFAGAYHAWTLYNGGTQYANKLSVYGLPPTSYYSGYKAVLRASDGSELASGTISAGTTQIDLTSVQWPADHRTYVQMYFPASDPLCPNWILDHARYPWGGSNTDVYDNRTAGFALTISVARSLMADLIREGASGCIANVDEPWSNYAGQPLYLFPRYAMGYTWGEAAYMGLAGIGWQEVALGDPLMAPYATPPTVAITAPASDGVIVSGTVHFAASATANGAPGIARVEYWLDDDALLASITSPPYAIDLDTVARGLADGLHSVEAVAYENDSTASAAGASRAFIVNNGGIVRPTVENAVAEPDGTLIAFQGKVVSAAFNGSFYIEEINRIRGLRVRSDTPVLVGDVVTVIGTLATVDGEREIAAQGVWK